MFGSYLHGPILPANPVFADALIGLAAERATGRRFEPERQDDAIADEARLRQVRRLASERNLAGWAKRRAGWRSRLAGWATLAGRACPARCTADGVWRGSLASLRARGLGQRWVVGWPSLSGEPPRQPAEGAQRDLHEVGVDREEHDAGERVGRLGAPGHRATDGRAASVTPSPPGVTPTAVSRRPIA